MALTLGSRLRLGLKATWPWACWRTAAGRYRRARLAWPHRRLLGSRNRVTANDPANFLGGQRLVFQKSPGQRPQLVRVLGENVAGPRLAALHKPPDLFVDE